MKLRKLSLLQMQEYGKFGIYEKKYLWRREFFHFNFCFLLDTKLFALQERKTHKPPFLDQPNQPTSNTTSHWTLRKLCEVCRCPFIICKFHCIAQRCKKPQTIQMPPVLFLLTASFFNLHIFAH